MPKGGYIAQQQAPVAGLPPLCQLKVLYVFIPNGRTWIQVVTDVINHRHLLHLPAFADSLLYTLNNVSRLAPGLLIVPVCARTGQTSVCMHIAAKTSWRTFGDENKNANNENLLWREVSTTDDSPQRSPVSKSALRSITNQPDVRP